MTKSNDDWCKLNNKNWHTGNWHFNSGDLVEDLLRNILEKGFSQRDIEISHSVSYHGDTLEFEAMVQVFHMPLHKAMSYDDFFCFKDPAKQALKIKGKAKVRAYFCSSMSAMSTDMVTSEMEVFWKPVD